MPAREKEKRPRRQRDRFSIRRRNRHAMRQREDRAACHQQRKAERDCRAYSSGHDQGIDDRKRDCIRSHQGMDQWCERQQDGGSQPGAVHGGGNREQSERSREGARRNIRIHDEEGRSGDRQGEACSGNESGAPSRRFAVEEPCREPMAGEEEQADRENVRCQQNPREAQMRQAY